MIGPLGEIQKSGKKSEKFEKVHFSQVRKTGFPQLF